MTDITLPRATVEQALEALENCSSEYGHRCNRCDSEVDEGGKVASALRAALAQQAEPVQAEPVQSAAWVDAYDMIDRFLRNNLRDDDYAEYSAALDSLYTAPQQAEPVQPAIPLENSREARQAIEAMLAEYDHPTNPNNAARAGWRAARLYAAPQQQAEPVQSAAWVDAYDMIDRFLRNNLRDDDYAEYSAALDSLYTAPQQQAEPVQPVAWAGYDLDAMVEAFSRVIEAHHSNRRPFHNPIDMDARTALRILRGFVPAMKATSGQTKTERS